MQIATETWSEAQPDIEVLCVRHWEEIAHNKSLIPLDPDWEKYKQLEAAGMLSVTTARDDVGALVGYQVYLITPHLHYRSSMTAMSDILYLAPEHRQGRLGINLMKHAEQELRNRNVQRVMQNVKLSNDWGRILERLGYKAFERIYAKILEG